MLTQFCLKPAGKHSPKRVLSKGRCSEHVGSSCWQRKTQKRASTLVKVITRAETFKWKQSSSIGGTEVTASCQGSHVNQSCSVKTPSLHSQIHADSTGTARLRCRSRWKEMHSHEVLLPARHLYALDGDCFSTTELLKPTVWMLLIHFKCELQHFEQTLQWFKLNCAFAHQGFCTDAEGQDLMSLLSQ